MSGCDTSLKKDITSGKAHKWNCSQAEVLTRGCAHETETEEDTETGTGAEAETETNAGTWS